MADGGYPACAHCIYPYYCERDEVEGEKRSKKERKREKKECTPEERERNDVYNKALRFFRTRIEILFGCLVRHKFFNGSGYSVETVINLFHLMWEMEKLRYDQRPSESPRGARLSWGRTRGVPQRQGGPEWKWLGFGGLSGSERCENTWAGRPSRDLPR